MTVNFAEGVFAHSVYLRPRHPRHLLLVPRCLVWFSGRNIGPSLLLCLSEPGPQTVKVSILTRAESAVAFTGGRDGGLRHRPPPTPPSGAFASCVRIIAIVRS